MLLTLADTTALDVREIRPADKPLIAAGVARLSPQSQYRRFLSPKPSLSSLELRHLTEVDGIDHYALVAVNARGDIVAVGRWIRLADDRGAAEIALTVCDDLQGLGLGSSLGHLLAGAARDRGVERFTADILAENVPARRLMRRLSQELTHDRAGSVDHWTASLGRAAAPHELAA